MKQSRRQRRWLRRLLAIAIGIAVALALGEVVVRIAIPVRNVGPSFTEFDAEEGRRLKPSFECERITPEFDMVLTTNSHGERGPERDPHADATLLFLGDSFTMGYGVDDGEEFPRLVDDALRQRFPKLRLDVVNEGVGGTGNGRWLHVLQQIEFDAPVRLVVMQVCGNDFTDNVRERLFRLDANGALVSAGPQRRRWYDTVQDLTEPIPGLAYSHLFCLAKQIVTTRFLVGAADVSPVDAPTTSETDAEDRLTLAILGRALGYCDRHHVPVVGLGVALRGRRLDLVKGLFADHGAPFLVPPSKADAPKLYYDVDGHWRPAGHREAARELVETLSRPPFEALLRSMAGHGH